MGDNMVSRITQLVIATVGVGLVFRVGAEIFTVLDFRTGLSWEADPLMAPFFAKFGIVSGAGITFLLGAALIVGGCCLGIWSGFAEDHPRLFVSVCLGIACFMALDFANDLLVWNALANVRSITLVSQTGQLLGVLHCPGSLQIGGKVFSC